MRRGEGMRMCGRGRFEMSRAEQDYIHIVKLHFVACLVSKRFNKAFIHGRGLVLVHPDIL